MLYEIVGGGVISSRVESCLLASLVDNKETKLKYFSDETRCGDPEQPLSSTVDRVSTDRVVYACVKGYKMEGNAERNCLPNGLWSGQSPTCSGAAY